MFIPPVYEVYREYIGFAFSVTMFVYFSVCHFSIKDFTASTRLMIQNFGSKIVSEYDQEIPQSQTADNPVAPRGRAAQPSRDTRKTN